MPFNCISSGNPVEATFAFTAELGNQNSPFVRPSSVGFPSFISRRRREGQKRKTLKPDCHLLQMAIGFMKTSSTFALGVKILPMMVLPSLPIRNVAPCLACCVRQQPPIWPCRSFLTPSFFMGLPHSLFTASKTTSLSPRRLSGKLFCHYGGRVDRKHTTIEGFKASKHVCFTWLDGISYFL